jgi:hypothetical protein
MLFGDNIHLNRGFLVSKSKQASEVKIVEDYIQQINIQLQNIISASQKHQKQIVQQKLANTPEQPTLFHEGQFVLATYPVRPPTKFSPKWRGPYVIVEKLNNVYYCQDIINQKIIPFYVDRLKLFNMNIFV